MTSLGPVPQKSHTNKRIGRWTRKARCLKCLPHSWGFNWEKVVKALVLQHGREKINGLRKLSASSKEVGDGKFRFFWFIHASGTLGLQACSPSIQPSRYETNKSASELCRRKTVFDVPTISKACVMSTLCCNGLNIADFWAHIPALPPSAWLYSYFWLKLSKRRWVSLKIWLMKTTAYSWAFLY